MKDFNALELIGLFESIEKLDSDIGVHKEAIKAIGLDIKGRFESFGKDNDIPAKKLKDAYKYYLSKFEEDKSPSEEDPLYNLMMKVDMGLEASNKSQG